MQISSTLRAAIENAPIRQYQLATLANLHPSTLSKILNGSARLRRFDGRVLAVARVLGIDPSKALDDEDSR